MTYTNTILILLGMLGILLHNLVELNKLNRDPSKANFRIWEYLKIEVYSILISCVVVIVAMIVKVEITQLEIAGKWLGLAFLAIGYMGQSILIFIMGKANKIIQKDETTNP